MTKLIAAFRNFANAQKKMKIQNNLPYFGLSPRSRSELRSYRPLHKCSVKFFPTFRDNLSATSSGVKNIFFGFFILKMAPISCPETSVRSYHYSLRNSPEERSSQNNLSRRWDIGLLNCDRQVTKLCEQNFYYVDLTVTREVAFVQVPPPPKKSRVDAFQNLIISIRI
jgi:hypothetical protein